MYTCQSKTNPELNYKHLAFILFLRISEKLNFHAALEWKQILKLCKLS